jgi:hypothetical protein
MAARQGPGSGVLQQAPMGTQLGLFSQALGTIKKTDKLSSLNALRNKKRV